MTVASIENRLRHGAAPVRVHALVEGIHVNARLLAIVGKAGVRLREELADEIHVRIFVEADAHHHETLRGVLLGQFDEHRELAAARFAPSGPKVHDQRLAAILAKNLVVTGEINHGRIGSGRGLVGPRRVFGSLELGPRGDGCGENNERDGREREHMMAQDAHGDVPLRAILSVARRRQQPNLKAMCGRG
jgi:hypothetical protein